MNALTKTTLKALIWKDLRISRKLLIWGLAVWSLFYLGCLFIVLVAPDLDSSTRSIIFRVLTKWGLVISFGGTMRLIASLTTWEHGDRSDVFLAYLPPSNAAILTSKTICLAIPCILWPLISFALAHIGDGPAQFTANYELFVRTLIAIWILIVGVTWLGGIMTGKNSGAIFCAFFTVIIIAGAVHMKRAELDEQQFWAFFNCIAMPVGLISYALGWAVGLRARRMAA